MLRRATLAAKRFAVRVDPAIIAGYCLLAMVAAYSLHTQVRVSSTNVPLLELLRLGNSPPQQIRVVILTPKDCAARLTLIDRLNAEFARDTPIYGIVMGAAGDSVTVASVRKASGAVFPLAFRTDKRLTTALARLGHRTTPVVLEFDQLRRLTRIEG